MPINSFPREPHPIVYHVGMPKGPRGERRPADVIGNAIKVARIATGEIEEDAERRAPQEGQGRQGPRQDLVARGANGDCPSGSIRTLEKEQTLGCLFVVLWRIPP